MTSSLHRHATAHEGSLRVEGRLGEAERARLAERIAEEFRVQLAGVKAACEAKHKMDLAQQRVDLLKVCLCMLRCVRICQEAHMHVMREMPPPTAVLV